MTTPFWMILISGLLPYIASVVAKAGKYGAKDNHNPREFLANQEGFRKRADWAQRNSFEIFPFFAAAVLVDAIRAEPSHVAMFSVLFVVTRILYIVCYIADWALLRTLVFGIGMACVVAIFLGA